MSTYKRFYFNYVVTNKVVCVQYLNENVKREILSKTEGKTISILFCFIVLIKTPHWKRTALPVPTCLL